MGELHGSPGKEGAVVPDLGELSRMLGSRKRRVISPSERPPAAVLVSLYGPGPDYLLLYTVRTHKVEHHKGEISFPGGVHDPGDSSLTHTALRESLEEIGVMSEHVEVLGLLDDTVTRSNFVVTPVVGRVEGHPYAFRLHEEEVEELLEVPLSHLADPANHVPHPLDPTGRRGYPAYKFGDHIIFGATAMMTTGLLGILDGGR